MTAHARRLKNDDALDAAPSRVEQIGVRSVEVAGRLLKTLAALDGPQTLSGLSAAAGLAPAKAHRYLVSLIREGFVEQNAGDGRYDFGGAARRVGRVANNRLDIIRIAGPILSDLREALRETAFMGVWTPQGPVVLECLDVPRPVSVVVRPGANLPVTTSAFGLICAAFLPPDTVEPFIARELAERPNIAEKLAERLGDIRRQGFSTVQGDMVRGLAAVAVPILDHRGQLVACLASVGQTDAFDLTPTGRPVRELKAAADRFSQLLG